MAMLMVMFSFLAGLAASVRAPSRKNVAGASSQIIVNGSTSTPQYAPGPIVLFQNSWCLDVRMDGSKDVQTSPCHGGDNQMWYFQGTLLKSLSVPNLCMDMALGSGNGANGGNAYGNVYMGGCSSAFNKQFAMGPADTIILPEADNRQLDQNQSPGNYNVWASPYSATMRPWKRWTVGGKVTVLGAWRPLQPLVDTLEIIFTIGTTKGKSSTRSSTWTASVTASVEAGIDVMGLSAKTSFSSTIGTSMSRTHSEYWEASEIWEWRQTLVAKPDEQYLWQFEYGITTEHVDEVTSKTRAYAKTAGRWQMPRCLPGYCVDNPTCQICHPVGEIF